jgi:hypothetical protein
MLGLMIGAPARADLIVDFSYSGTGTSPNTATGNGSFQFADGLSTLGKSDLTSFSFTQTVDTKEGRNVKESTVTYGLSDLTSFSATIGSGPEVTSLSLQTKALSGEGYTAIYAFNISNLGPGGAETTLKLGIVEDTGAVSITSITSSSPAVPEPSSAILAAFGTVALGAYGWCRNRRAQRRLSAV